MRRILRFIALALAVFLPSVVYARGGRQTVTETADGIDIWQKEFDVSGMKPGTYNVIVNAKDAAGNIGVSGPFNIRIDPMAGLPEVRVVYPEQGQVMRGDVHIVGVATARYGLKQILVKIDDGEYTTLEGLEYWNLNVPSRELGEGRHTISVKAIDSNDLTGPEIKSDFILDVVPPVFELVGREIGDLISGTVKVKGKVTDVNGLQSLEISTDGGSRFTSLRHSGGRKGDPSRYFEFSIPSKKYDDGPLVYFLRAINKTGYSETKPFLFFVNNYAPQIEILAPTQTEDSFRETQVTGRVISGVGLTQFYYEWQGERHDIPLRPGDPFWTVNVHFSLANNRPVPFRITAVDKSGNTTVVTQNFRDTRKNRDPVLAIDYPARPAVGRMQLDQDQGIYGHILPGFFANNILIEGVIEYVMAQPSFYIPPELIPPGATTLRMWAMDEEGTTGEPFAIRINKPAATTGIESPITMDSPQYWDDYGDYRCPYLSDSVTYEGYVDNFSGQSVEYRLKWDDTWKPVSVDSQGNFTQTVSLAEFSEGSVPIEFRTVSNGAADIPVYMPVNKFTTKPEITFLTPAQRFGVVQRATTAAGIIDYFVPLSEVSYSLDGQNFTPMDFTAKYNRSWFNGYFDFTAMNTDGQILTIRAIDRAGNVAYASPDFTFDNTDAFPIIIHNAPVDGQLVAGDFEISGLAYVDVGIHAVFYRILSPRNPWDTVQQTLLRRNEVEFEQIETSQNYYVPLTLADVRDGENILEIFAEDIYGVTGQVTQKIFKVSTAAPETVVLEPPMDIWNRNNILVKGTSFDLNGIDELLISMDNGISYQRTDFESRQDSPGEWSISLNTRAYTDGVYSMLVRTLDRFGVSSFSNGIINIDNSPPSIDLGSPGNGDAIGVILPITGQVYDNIGLKGLSIQLVNNNDPSQQMTYEPPANVVIMESMDVSEFPDGDYSLKVSAFDQSGNENSVIRNVTVIKARAASEVAIINPLPGIEHTGPIVVSGKITGAVIPEKVTLMVDRQAYTSLDVNRYGIFSYDLPEENVATGRPVIFSAAFDTPGGERIVSFENPVTFSSFGPILEVDSHRDGDVITKRPWISGRAYMVRPDDDSGGRKGAKGAGVDRVELSFDNGRSFLLARGTDKWKFRLETGELAPGTMPIVIKASFEDGSSAIRRILLTVDTQAPSVNTMGPSEGSSYRDTVAVYGSVTDNYDMDSVEVSLRPGDKAGYAVPGFIQGLYLDASFLGGLNYSLGLGLTFFDDNVKVQINASEAPSGRYSGWAFGGKVLANVYNANLAKWFGPDWEFWKTSLVIGAHFSYFLMEDEETPVWMGQFLGQWEIIKADMGFFFPNWKYFKSFSIYTEPGIWFAPSDVNSQQAWRTKFTIGFGGRISLF